MKLNNILINGPKEAKNILILAHGAGAPMDSVFMNTISDGLNKNQIMTIRFEFPYMSKRRMGKNSFPDNIVILCDFYKNLFMQIKKIYPKKNIWIGGKSMGGRISAIISTYIDIKGVVVFGYPFHPIKNIDKLRLSCLKDEGPPILIIQGTRDKFGNRNEVKKYKINKKNEIYWIEGGDHSFNTLKKSPISYEDAIVNAYSRASNFIKKSYFT